MIRRSTWVLLVILAALVVLTTVYQRNKEKKEENAATTTPTISTPQLLDLETSQVSRVDITSSTGEMLKLYKAPETTLWAISDVPVKQADSALIETKVDLLLTAELIETLAEIPPLDAIGLLVPSYEITVASVDGSEVVVLVGKLTPVGTGYYTRIEDGPVSIVEKSGIESALDMLTTPPLLPTPTAVMPTQAVTPGQITQPTDSLETTTPAP
jgi:hypothetical protein